MFKYFYQNLNKLDSFSISDLQQFSGVKAHTIRIWEQRYKALQPRRTEGNTRYYSGDQLRRLLNIVSLMDTDRKVSELCTMSDEQLRQLLDEQLSLTTSQDTQVEFFISQIVAAAMRYSEERFDRIFSSCLLRYGLRDTYIKVIYPALVRLGIMWSKDELPAGQEHFITALFRQKFLAAIDALPPATQSKDSWLLFLPQEEFHETGLLFANYLLRLANKKVIYLGANVPVNSLAEAIEDINPAHLLFFLVRKNNVEADAELLHTLGKDFPAYPFYVAADPARLKNIPVDKNFTALHSVDDLDRAIHS